MCGIRSSFRFGVRWLRRSEAGELIGAGPGAHESPRSATDEAVTVAISPDCGAAGVEQGAQQRPAEGGHGDEGPRRSETDVASARWPSAGVARPPRKRHRRPGQRGDQQERRPAQPADRDRAGHQQRCQREADIATGGEVRHRRMAALAGRSRGASGFGMIMANSIAPAPRTGAARRENSGHHRRLPLRLPTGAVVHPTGSNGNPPWIECGNRRRLGEWRAVVRSVPSCSARRSPASQTRRVALTVFSAVEWARS